jgi:DNA-binding response OmpR family regulator
MASQFPAADSHRILIVEDNMLVAEVLCELMTEQGYRVIGPCARLSGALKLAAREAIDAALLDINLAGEPCCPLADLLRRKGVPFAFLTGYGGTVIPAAFRDVPILTKPVNPPDIVDVMVTQLGLSSVGSDARDP